MSEKTRFWALGVSENLKDFSEIIQTECKRSGCGSPKQSKNIGGKRTRREVFRRVYCPDLRYMVLERAIGILS